MRASKGWSDRAHCHAMSQNGAFLTQMASKPAQSPMLCLKVLESTTKVASDHKMWIRTDKSSHFGGGLHH